MSIGRFGKRISNAQSRIEEFYKNPPKINDIIADRCLVLEKLKKEFKARPLYLNHKNWITVGNPFCPSCGSKDISKNGSHPRSPIMPFVGMVLLVLQMYICKGCGNVFWADIEDFVQPYRHYNKTFQSLALYDSVDHGVTLRNAMDTVRNIFGLGPAHNTIHGWQMWAGGKSREDIDGADIRCSGVVCYDERCVLGINKKNFWEMTLIDWIYRNTIHIKVVRSRTNDLRRDVLKRGLAGKVVRGIFTDLDDDFETVVSEALPGCPHQVCTRHMRDLIDEKVRMASGLKRKRKAKLPPEYKKIKDELKTIIDPKKTKNREIAACRLYAAFERYYGGYGEEVDYILNFFKSKFKKLTHFLEYPFFGSGDNNEIESLFKERKRRAKQKDRFKTEKGAAMFTISTANQMNWKPYESGHRAGKRPIWRPEEADTFRSWLDSLGLPVEVYQDLLMDMMFLASLGLLGRSPP